MRQIILDTETTGLDPALGHRIVELACVEVVNRRVTERTFHQYLNPQRPSDPGALAVHGLTQEFLEDKPRFAEVARDFLEFLNGDQIVIHNAPFDLAFLNAELARVDLRPIESAVASVVDTLRLARELHPGRRNSLDALCERYAIDNSARTLHGALLDARLLGEVYLAMTRGQESLVIESTARAGESGAVAADLGGLSFVVQPADEQDLGEHARYLEQLDKAAKGSCVWRQLGEGSVA
ncbi:MAG: DNA polymerase III subunit epsilon [Betaproteobacteria bacterium]